MTVEAAVPDITAWPPLDDEMRVFGRQLLDWVADDGGARATRLCLVRGGKGSGKSYLLAWFLAGAGGHPRTTVHATVPAEGLTAETFAWELGRQLGYGPLSPARLLDRVSQDDRPLLLLVPDLHRAGAGPADLAAATPAGLVAELLEPLLLSPHLRAVVEVGDREPLSADGAESIVLGERDTGGEPAELSFSDLLSEVPRTPDDRPDWSQAPAPVLRYILDAALRAGDDADSAVRALLTDPGFLVHGSATALTATLADERVPVPGQLRRVWRRAAPELTAHHTDSAERAALLHCAAVDTDATLAAFLRPLAQQHWWYAVWARSDVPVAALATVPGDQGTLVVADVSGRMRTHSVETGAVTGVFGPPPAPGAPCARPDSVVPFDSGSALLLDGRAGTLSALAPEEYASGETPPARIAEHHGARALADEWTRVTALGGGPGSPYAIVGDRAGSLHVWSLTGGQDVPRSWRVHERPVTAAACLHLVKDDPGDEPGDGATLVFSAAPDGSVRLWETSAEPMPVPVEQRPYPVTALAAADTTAVGPVLAVAWSDAEVRLWHVLSGRVRALPLPRVCDALALTSEGLLAVGDLEGVYAVRLRLDGLWGA